MQEGLPLWVAALSAGSALLGGALGVIGTLLVGRQARKHEERMWLIQRKHDAYEMALSNLLPLVSHMSAIVTDKDAVREARQGLDAAEARMQLYAPNDQAELSMDTWIKAQNLITDYVRREKNNTPPEFLDGKRHEFIDSVQYLIAFMRTDLKRGPFTLPPPPHDPKSHTPKVYVPPKQMSEPEQEPNV